MHDIRRKVAQVWKKLAHKNTKEKKIQKIHINRKTIMGIFPVPDDLLKTYGIDKYILKGEIPYLTGSSFTIKENGITKRFKSEYKILLIRNDGSMFLLIPETGEREQIG